MHVAPGIAPELIVRAAPIYCTNVELLDDGPVKDALVNILAGMTGKTQVDLRGGWMSRPMNLRK